MAIIKDLKDPIRTKILAAMTKKGAVAPNIKQIKKITNLHRATIKSSIEFMEQEKLINGYRPLLDPRVVGYNLIVHTYLQTNTSDKTEFNKLMDAINKDKNILSFSEVICEGNYNLAISFLCKNIEEYHINFKKKYYETTPSLYETIKQKNNFYLSEPIYKKRNEIDTLIELLKEEKGIKD